MIFFWVQIDTYYVAIKVSVKISHLIVSFSNFQLKCTSLQFFSKQSLGQKHTFIYFWIFSSGLLIPLLQKLQNEYPKLIWTFCERFRHFLCIFFAKFPQDSTFRNIYKFLYIYKKKLEKASYNIRSRLIYIWTSKQKLYRSRCL